LSLFILASCFSMTGILLFTLFCIGIIVAISRLY
jgi:hypothetical protein